MQKKTIFYENFSSEKPKILGQLYVDREQLVEHILPLVGLSCGEGEAVASSFSLPYLDMILLLSFS